MTTENCFEYVDKLLVLVACKDCRGLYRFPGNCSGLPGLLIAKGDTIPYSALAIHGNDPLGKLICQLDIILQSTLNEAGLGPKVKLEHVILPPIELSESHMALLVLGRLSPEEFIAPESWPTLPEILKKMQRNKMRSPYLKAFQLLSGALEQEVDAYEFGGSKSSELLEKIWNNK